MGYTEKDVKDILNALMRDCQGVINLRRTPFEDMQAIDDAEHVLNYLNAGFENNVRSILIKANDDREEPDFYTVWLVLRAFYRYIFLNWKGMDDIDPEDTDDPEGFSKEYDTYCAFLKYMDNLHELAAIVQDFIPMVKAEKK